MYIMSDNFTGEELASCGECGIEGTLDWVQEHFLEHFEKENNDPNEFKGSTNPKNDVENPLSPLPSGNDSEAAAKLWNDSSTVLLIRLVEKNYSAFDGTMKKIIWKKIASELSKIANKNFTPEQVDTKWKGLKRTYKKIKDHNSETGRNRKAWQFFDSMDTFLNKQPEIEAPATCSSESGLHMNPKNEAVTPTTSRDSHNKKRTLENSSERRHKEKINRMDRFLDLYQLSVEHQIGKKLNDNNPKD